MPPEKRIMLQCRLQKRLNALNIPNFKSYCDYLFSNQGQAEELTAMIDAVCTNKTDFFRESAHFEYLTKELLPEKPVNAKLKIWSAGCSTGDVERLIPYVPDQFVLAIDLAAQEMRVDWDPEF